jgi:amino acid transporter
MQITGVFIFLAVWLAILWGGAIALEATGMERSKAFFQSLSALSNTGFTTRQAEDIVEYPKRRRIVSWLIFFGCVGITAFLFLMILYVKSGIAAPSATHIGIIVGSLVILIILIWTGVIRWLTTIILKLFRKGPVNVEMLHQAEDYAVARIKITEKNKTGLTVGKFQKGDLTVLAIERDGKVISSPKDAEALQAGDYLLCYGKTEELTKEAG